MLVELKKKCTIETSKKLVVVFDFNSIAEATKFAMPFVSTTKGPAVIDLTDKSEVSIVYAPEETGGEM